MVYRLLADLVLAVHAGFILFVVGGLVAVLLGAALGWRWVRSPWFRWTHLAAIGLVVGQAWLGVACPLTVVENELRLLGGQQPYASGGFIATWLHRVMFFEAPGWVFMLIYTGFGLLVAASFWLVPPRRARAG